MIEETRRVDERTGEVVSRQVRKLAAMFDENEGYLLWVRKNFAKSFMDVQFPKSMSYAERGRLATLSKHIWSKTNMLGYKGNGGVRAYSAEQIGRLINLKEYQAGAFIRKMVRLGIMARVEVKTKQTREVQYYINPLYFFSSNRLSLNLYLLFREQLDAVLPSWVKEEFGRQGKDSVKRQNHG